MDFSKKLKALNTGKSVKLRLRKLSNGVQRFYLDYRKNNVTEYKTLDIYIENKRSTVTQDKQNLEIACKVRDKFDLEFKEQNYNINLITWKSEKTISIFYAEIAKMKNTPNWYYVQKHVDKFFKNTRIRSVNDILCQKFANYLQSNLSLNTANLYFARFKSVMQYAVEKNMISKNPTKGIKLKQEETKREFLTIDEIKVLYNTECVDNNVKNAFIFSCFTGLRYSDVVKIKYDDIEKFNDSQYLYIKVRKTSDTMRLKLHEVAIEMIEKQRVSNGNKGRIFPIDIKSSMYYHLHRWIKSTNIKKHVTFHVARHSFATNSLSAGADITTISKLLNHKDVSTTMIYDKVVDKLKDKAIDDLPGLE